MPSRAHTKEDEDDTVPHQFCYPEKIAQEEISHKMSIENYLKACKNNILAEFWMLLARCTPKDLPKLSVVFSTKHHTRITSATRIGQDGKTEPVPIQNLRGHLFVFKEQLLFGAKVTLTCGCRYSSVHSTDANACPLHDDAVAEIHMQRGATFPESISTEHPELEEKDVNKYIFEIGYVMNYIKMFQNLESLLKVISLDEYPLYDDIEIDPKSLLSMLRNPKRRDMEIFEWKDSKEESHHFFLEDSQRVICRALSKTIEFIRGPPGTGKSTIVGWIIKHLTPRREKEKILVCTAQNKPIDVIANKIMEAMSKDMVILSSRTNEKLSALALTRVLGNQVECHERVIEARRALDEAIKAWQKNRENEDLAEEIIAARKKLGDTIGSVRKEILNAATVILCTFDELNKIVSSGKARDIRDYPLTVIVDEAASVPEYCFPTFACIDVKRIICVGDEKQLPPFTYADSDGLPSFFQRAVKLVDSHLLTLQFRMDDSICEIVSKLFYGGKLESSPSLAFRNNKVLPLLPGCDNRALCWIPSNDNAEEVPPKSSSKYNQHEVSIVVDALKILDRRGIFKNTADFPYGAAVIAFYAEQRNRICELLPPAFQPYFETGRLRVNTVDSFQGSEADVVILSSVRSNSENSMGFLAGESGENRLCVAFSRARNFFLVTANYTTLRNSRTFKTLLDACNRITVEDLKKEPVAGPAPSSSARDYSFLKTKVIQSRPKMKEEDYGM